MQSKNFPVISFCLMIMIWAPVASGAATSPENVLRSLITRPAEASTPLDLASRENESPRILASLNAKAGERLVDAIGLNSIVEIRLLHGSPISDGQIVRLLLDSEIIEPDTLQAWHLLPPEYVEVVTTDGVLEIGLHLDAHLDCRGHIRASDTELSFAWIGRDGQSRCRVP